MSFTPSENPITHPERESYTQLRPFRFWCQKVLPLVYDDSLSYYELLCKVVDYLNKTMEDVDHMNTDMDTLYSNFQEFQEGTFRIYNELVAYVNAYFENLDVQEEINNKLDDMVTSGELVTVLQPTIAEEVASWLDEHITPTTPSIDDTLSIRGAAADAKATGDEINGIKSTIAETFSSEREYKNGEYVYYNGLAYKFIMDKPTGAWDPGFCITANIGNDIYEDQETNSNLLDKLREEIGERDTFIPYFIENGVYDSSMVLNTAVGGCHLTAYVEPNKKYIIAGRRWVKSYPAILFLHNNDLIGFYDANTSLQARFTDVEINTPDNCNKVIVNGITYDYTTGSPMIKKVNIEPDTFVYENVNIELDSGVYQNTYELNAAAGAHGIAAVNGGEKYIFSGYKYGNNYPLLLYRYNGNFVGYAYGDINNNTLITNKYLEIPYNVDQIVIQADSRNNINIKKITEIKDLTGTVNKANSNEVKINGVINSLAAVFSENENYKNGEYVIYNNVVYKFIMGKPAGAFDVGYCVAANITDDIYKNNVDNNELLDKLKEDLGTYTSLVPYVLSNGVYDVNMNLNTSVGGQHLTASVKEKTKYLISGQRWVKSYPAVLFFNDNTLLGFYDGNTSLQSRFTGVEVITPSNCNKVIINGITNGYDTGSPMIREVDLVHKNTVFTACEFNTESGVYDYQYNFNSVAGVHSVFNVSEGDIIRYSSFKFANSYPVLLFKNNGSFVGYSLGDFLAQTRQRNEIVVIPENVDQIVVQCDSKTRIKIEKLENINEVGSWYNKNILFLGTSITATGTVFRDEYYTIPDYICHLLNANAIIQSKGESMVRNGYSFLKSETDPYGWTGAYWNNIAYSLSMTIDEKNELINNWTTKWRDLLIGDNKPQTLSEENINLFRSCSYENRLMPYLNGTLQKPDLIVIEHGRNDIAAFNPTADNFSGLPSVNPDSITGFDRGLYGDAMAYIIRIIREHLRDVPILIIGHFDNSGMFEDLPKEQEKCADYNGVFFCGTITTGWNNCKVTVTGHFVNGYWVEDGVTRVIPRRNQNLADTIHPASTLSGEPIMIESGIIASYIASNIVPQI